MRGWIRVGLLVAVGAAVAPVLSQETVARPIEVQAPVAVGCCGPVTPAGVSLVRLLDGMNVEHRWLSDRHVHWESGRPEGGIITDGKPHTHCSAFAAAAGERLGIYLLRPPEHAQLFLASAQGRWFTTEQAAAHGWVKVETPREAQVRANRGELVILDYINPVPGKHGHIAIVRPMVKSNAALEAEGPETMQAGQTNFSDGNAVRSFHSHEGAWPEHVLMYAHATKMSAAEIKQAFEEDKTLGEEPLEPLQP